MNELYWMTRLDAIHNICTALIVICSFLTCGLIIGFFANKSNGNGDATNTCKKWLITNIIVLISTAIIQTFTPTTKEALLIYGVGGTVDYIESNETVKQLPDKAIQALDKYLDSMNEEKK
jgi:hypothetical protein